MPKPVAVVSTRSRPVPREALASQVRVGSGRGVGVATYEQTPEGKTEHRIDGSGAWPSGDDSEPAPEDLRPEARLPVFEATRADWFGQSTPTPTGSGDPSRLDLSEAFLHWPPRSVADTDPFDFGINTGAGRPGLRLNPYVPRDVDAELDRALASPDVRGVIVVADRGSGAKRTVFEALRRNRPGSPLMLPRTPLVDDLETLFHEGIADAYPGSILWLADLAAVADRSGSSLLRLQGPHATVIGLVRSEGSQRLDLGADPSVRSIRVPDRLSDGERDRAQRLYPDRPLRDHLGFAFGNRDPAVLSRSSRAAIARALQLAGRRRERQGTVDATLLMLGASIQAVETDLPGATSAFVQFLCTRHPERPDTRTLFRRLAAAAGVRDSNTSGDRPLDQNALTRPPLSRLLKRAEDLATQVTGSREAHLRHVLAAAVASDDPPIDPGVLAELRLSVAALRSGLREAVRDEPPLGEPLDVWDELLGGPDVPRELAGGISADRVDPTTGIPLSRDHLGTAVYVSMFASVITSRDTPMPLSIGVFGEWGSGKSYFMGLLREQVDQLARSGNSGYLSDVVQIGFNAWHYADSNLWASLGDEIFRQLTCPSERAEDQRAQLREELAGKLAQRRDLEATTAQARAETARLQAQLDQATAARDTRAVDLVHAVKSSQQLQGQFNKVWKRLGVDDEAEQGRMLADQLRGTASDAAVLRRSLAGRTGRRATILAAILLALLAAGALLLPATNQWLARGGLATLSTLAAASLAIIARVRSGLRQLRQLATDLQSRADAAAAERQDRALAEHLTALRQAETDERVVQAQLDEVITQVGELGRQLTDLAPGMRLYRFLAERAAGDAYTRHLGLISTIRKDFEQLIELMDDWRRNAHGERARRPIDRIILYIDDLDRCSPQQVVDVLQAVHLMLALDLFVVVVGVDPRWLLRSLRHQYRSILTATADGIQPDQPTWETTPEDYLEKIFNIPFALPGMNEGALGRLLRSLSTDRDTPAPPATPRTTPPPDASQAAPPPGERPADGDQPPPPEAFPVEQGSEVAAAQHGTPEEQPPRPLTEPELQLLAALEPLIDTPREAKRLLNLYRMLRATRDLSPASRFLGEDGRHGEFEAVIILLGLLTAHARLLGQVLDAPPSQDHAVRGGLAHRPDSGSWAEFVKALQPRRDGAVWTNDIVGRIPEADLTEWRRLGAGIQQASQGVTLPDLSAFQRWAPQIRRFSFVLSPLAGKSRQN
jgi:hypothetical protein